MIIESGTVINGLKVVKSPDRWGKRRFVAVTCICGKYFETRMQGEGIIAKSCGCLNTKRAQMLNTKHGHSPRGKASSTYNAWHSMVQRCHNQNSKAYEWYGARGIFVCDRWKESFSAFLADMGECPPKLEIERKDNSRGYEPGNCIWATRSDQMRNTRYTRMVSVWGHKMCVRDAARAVGIPETKIYGRVRDKMVGHQEAFDFYMNKHRLEIEGVFP